MNSCLTAPDEALRERVYTLWERTGDAGLGRLVATWEDGDELIDGTSSWAELAEQQREDWINTLLMDCYRQTGDQQVFALLYERNEAAFLQAIQLKLRRCSTAVDAHDVLQEVFLNIYRYPHRFAAEKPDAFRNWGHRIARNTLLKTLKTEGKRRQVAAIDDEVGQFEDARSPSPLRSAADSESATLVDHAYILYLNLYLLHFDRLSQKEKRALTMVEVDGATYKDTAAALGIRIENLKMVIFRGRRKVLHGMHRSLAYLEAFDQVTAPDSATLDGFLASAPCHEL